MIDLNSVVNNVDYNFLKNNEHLKNKMLFINVSGSHSYGTNVETSDIDIRGVALNNCSELLGFSHFEQYEDNKTDTVIYGFNKFINLVLNCNPNVIEMLGCKPEHYIFYNKIGQQLIDNRKMFLSKKCINSFGGYAIAQLRRLENAIARDAVPQEKKEEHILKSMQGAITHFEDRYTKFDDNSLILYTDVSKKEELNSEIFADITLKHYPVREFNSIMNDLKSIIVSYEKLDGRNRKKDELHLNKHAMHLLRLYITAIDILEKEDIITYRKDEHDLLMSVRNGKYMNDDGTYKNEFFELLNKYENRFNYACKNTNLPDHPDMKKVEDFVVTINKEVINHDNYNA